MEFNVIQEEKKFVITDAEGYTYGSFDSKKEAATAAIFWKEYYEAPLVFGNVYA